MRVDTRTFQDLLRDACVELPLRVEPYYNVADGNGRLLVTTGQLLERTASTPAPHTAAQARAELVVRAVNSHQRLVDALDRLVAVEEQSDVDGIDETTYEAAMDEARAALAEARGAA